MKKYITVFLLTTIISLMVPLTATTVAAQTRYYTTRDGRVVVVKRPNFYQRHRKAINIGGGTAAGMLLGGLIGGRKGVLIGGLAGAGGGALFTHKQRPTNYYRRTYLRRTYRNY